MNQTRAHHPVLYLVIPCYNEEQGLGVCAETLREYFRTTLRELVSPDSRVLFVDDGSTDNTWGILQALHAGDTLFEAVRLSRNRGHQMALYAGMMEAKDKADCVITIDADLQQDIRVMPQFLAQYSEGCDVVYGIRNSRKTDGFFKRWSATLYYKMMRFLGVDLVEQSADYRLLSAQALEELAEYRESNLFIRGIVPTLGLKSGAVHFDVRERTLGTSKYTLRKMTGLAADGITSFSIRPLRIIMVLGILISVASLIKIIHAVWEAYFGTPISGWASLTVSIWFLGGVNFIALGIIGEYIGRTYMESKKRPRYFISDTLLHAGGESVTHDSAGDDAQKDAVPEKES